MDIKEYRKELDEIDNVILRKLEERLKVCERIGEYKKENSIPVFDEKREEEKLDKIAEDSIPEYKEHNIKVFESILWVSKERQEKIIHGVIGEE